MNRDELLTKLAMELEEWPAIQTEWSHLKFRYDLMDDLVIPLDRAWDEVITARDWIQRRTELINKPEWSEAPEWAQWLAQDSDGEWYWNENKPEHDHSGWVMEYETTEAQELASEGAIPAGHDWTQTLEKRPAFNESRADAIGQNGNDGHHYCTDGQPCGESPIPGDDAYCIGCPAAPDVETAHLCNRCGGSYYSPPHDECPCQQNATSKYRREIRPGVFVDVYDILAAWRVVNPALQHLIKKALQPGVRGHKTCEQDMADIVASAKRAQELEE